MMVETLAIVLKARLFLLFFCMAFAGPALEQRAKELQPMLSERDATIAEHRRRLNDSLEQTVEKLERMLTERDSTIADLRRRLTKQLQIDTAEGNGDPEKIAPAINENRRAIGYALMAPSLMAPGETDIELGLSYACKEDFHQAKWSPMLLGRVGLPKELQFDISFPYYDNAGGDSDEWGGIRVGLVKALWSARDRNGTTILVSVGKEFSHLTVNGSTDVGVLFSREAAPLVITGHSGIWQPYLVKIKSVGMLINIGAGLEIFPELAVSASLTLGRQPRLSAGETSGQKRERTFAALDLSLEKILTRRIAVSTGLGLKVMGSGPDLQFDLSFSNAFLKRWQSKGKRRRAR